MKKEKGKLQMFKSKGKLVYWPCLPHSSEGYAQPCKLASLQR